MKTFKAFTLGALLVASPFTQAEKELSVKEGVKKCKELIAEHCGDKSFEDCMKKEDPKSGKVGECVSFMVKNRKAFDLNDLNPNFQTLLKDINDQDQDASKCIETAKMVCGEGADLKDCLRQQAGRFPSYCRDLARDRVDKMQAAYDNDPKLQGCTKNLMKQCKLDLGSDTETDRKVLMAGMAKYQACLKKMLPKTRGCGELVKVDKKTKPSQSVQLINQ